MVEPALLIYSMPGATGIEPAALPDNIAEI